MTTPVIPDPVNSCGYLTLDPGCKRRTYENGLGPGLQHAITLKWINPPAAGGPEMEVWVFVDGYKPYKLADFIDGQTYSVAWDLRKTLQDGTVQLGLVVLPTRLDQNQGGHGRTILKTSLTTFPNHVELLFRDLPDGTYTEVDQLNPNACGGQDYVLGVFNCCPVNCTKPYDNTVFCEQTHNEAAFGVLAATDPGFAKQAFLATEAGVQPIRGIALTRSADAWDADTKLLYGSQRWVLVWDFEVGRLMDVFPQEWLRYGAGFYYQHVSLRKEVAAGFSSRKPYYIEVVDLGLVNTPQGAFRMDLDANGQRTDNWDVPSRILALHREGQQRPVQGWGMPRPVGHDALYTEFNHLSVDAFRRVCDEAAPALRERFFKDRQLFTEMVTKQKYHDQLMFMTKEVAERTLRAMTDMVENGRQLIDTFNPQAQDSFGYYMIALVSAISQKMLRAKNDGLLPNPSGFKMEADEATASDWTRFIYGELRRLVDMTHIDKNFQTTVFSALQNLDPTDPTSLLKSFQKLIDTKSIKQQFDIAADGQTDAGGGVLNPDIKADNEAQGLVSSGS